MKLYENTADSPTCGIEMESIKMQIQTALKDEADIFNLNNKALNTRLERVSVRRMMCCH